MQLRLLFVLFSCYISKASRRPRDAYKEFGYLSPQESFKFSFECGIWNETYCASAQESVKEVGMLIANQLLFRIPVQVKFKFENLTNNPFNVYKAYLKTLTGLELRKVVGDVVGPVTNYPYSLIKQIDLTPRLFADLNTEIFSYENHDIVVIMNQRCNWTINPDFPNSNLNAIDFQRKLMLNLGHVAKMITMGLGFYSQFGTYYVNYRSRKE